MTNLGNGYSVISASTIAAPITAGVMDVSSRIADVLDMKAMGTARVKVEMRPAPIVVGRFASAGKPAHRRIAGQPRWLSGPGPRAAGRPRRIFALFWPRRTAGRAPPKPARLRRPLRRPNPSPNRCG